MKIGCLRLVCSFAVAATALTAEAVAQAGGIGVDREAMWPAPTAEDWARPCLIPWQRTFEDAVAVAQETGKPLLLCVNMDGEIASEHYAGIRYRQPDIAALYEPYVTVIASVYRHTPRDHDEDGRRILCPRFGSVTCGEHIAIEPKLYDRFMEGRRIAPRHIMVELDGKETYDVFYAWDTDSVFDTIRQGIANRPTSPAPVIRGDRTLADRVASRDNADQTAVEKAYFSGDANVRRTLLEAAAQQGDQASVDLLRLGIFGLDTEMNQLARQTLAQANSDHAMELISDALRVPMEAKERDDLIGALDRIGEQTPKARTLAVVHRGLATESQSVNVGGWSSALANVDPAAAAIDQYAMENLLQDQNQVLEAEDPEALIELAEAFLSQGFDARFFDDETATDEGFARLLFLDAQKTAEESRRLGGDSWRTHTVLALASYYLGEHEKTLAHAEKAVNQMPEGDPSWNTMAVLELFAKLRCQEISKAVQAKREWPGSWLTDVNAACSVLARHPHGTDAQIAWHYDILKWLGAGGQASRALQHGLQRFPESMGLHERLRGSVLRRKGVLGLESVYEKMLAKGDASPRLVWFAGYASVVAAEFHRRRGNEAQAQAAYDRAIDLYEKAIEHFPDERPAADHTIAMALGGQARILLEQEKYQEAVDRLLSSFQRSPTSAATLDGLNLSSVDTAKMVLARVREAEDLELSGRLEQALQSLDAELLKLPAYEFEVRDDAATN